MSGLHSALLILLGIVFLGFAGRILVFLSRGRFPHQAAMPLFASAASGALSAVLLVIGMGLLELGAASSVITAFLVVALVLGAGALVVFGRTLPKLAALPTGEELSARYRMLTADKSSLIEEISERTRELDLANRHLELALMRSNITLFEQDKDLRYVWVINSRLIDDREWVGKGDEDILSGEALESLTSAKQAVLKTGDPQNLYLPVNAPSGDTLYLDVMLNPYRDDQGGIIGVQGIATDLTEQKLFEIRLAALTTQLAEATRRFETALAGSLITVFEQDLELRYTHIVNPPLGTRVEDFVGKQDGEIFAQDDLLKMLPAKQNILNGALREKLEVDLHLGKKLRSFDITLEARLDPQGTCVGIVGTVVDMTRRKENELQMHLVMRELTHRSKNLLAVIQAMARQTAARSDDMDTFVSSFSARLQAMAASHDLLVSSSWYGAGLRELLRAHLGQTIDPESPQIQMEGPDLDVTADTAQNLGLAFHELTTNAAKHGALSVPDGAVKVSWSLEDGKVHFVWQESGGPTVSAPQRRGFGRLLLERSVGVSLNGTVELIFAPEGLQCRIDFPEDRLLSERKTVPS